MTLNSNSMLYLVDVKGQGGKVCVLFTCFNSIMVPNKRPYTQKRPKMNTLGIKFNPVLGNIHVILTILRLIMKSGIFA